MSALGQKRTSAALFNHFVGAAKYHSLSALVQWWTFGSSCNLSIKTSRHRIGLRGRTYAKGLLGSHVSVIGEKYRSLGGLCQTGRTCINGCWWALPRP